MRIILILFTYFLYIAFVLGDKIPAGYVATWDTTPLSQKDYEMNDSESCQSFAGILKQGKKEQPHITAFKIINDSLNNFIKGYNDKEQINIDTVVIWPNFEQNDWYVLMGYQNCFVRWIEIIPDNIQSIMDEGKKL